MSDDDDVRDTLIDCMTSANIHGDLAQAAADILLSDASGLTIGVAGQVVPQQPSDYEHDEKCEHAALQQSHGVRMCRCALRAGLIPGPVGQDTKGNDG
jgi:hypothetical protein